MKSLKKYIAFLFLAFISLLASANTNTDDLVKHAVAQLNKLYTENTDNDVHGKHEDNWYIYILGGTVKDLEFIKNETNKSFTSGYLTQLNELLKQLNKKEKVAVYVAFTDYTSELITPIFPTEYNTLTTQELYISQLLEGNAAKEETVQFFRNYKAFLNSTIKRIYDQSLLSASKKANIFMPFTNFENRTIIDNETQTITNTIKKYKTYTLYTPKKENFEIGKYKKRYGEILPEYGKTDAEINIERVVRTLNDYYYGEEIEYKECQELLAKAEYQKYLNQDEIWREIIENDPCILSHIQKLHGDYIGDTEFAQELRRVVNTMLYGAMAIPASSIIGEYALYELGKTLIKKYGAKKAKEVSQAAISNIVIQAVQNYYFDENSYDEDDFLRMQKALQNIDKIELSKEVFVAACDINMRGDLILTCVIAGLRYDQNEWYDISEYDFDFLACRDDVVEQIILGAVLKTGGAVFSKMHRVVKSNPKMFIRGFRDILNETGADGAKAFREYLRDIKGAFDINDKSLIGIKLDVETRYGDEVEQLAVDRNFKDLTKDVISEIEYTIANTSSEVTKLGVNIELDFPGYSGNIRPTILTEFSDGSYKMVFVVNKSASINSIDDFINNTNITGNRKEILSNFQPNTKAILKGNNAQKYFGKQDVEINVKNIEIYTIDANGNPVRNEVGVKGVNAVDDWLVTLKSNSSFKSYFDDLVTNPSTRKFVNTLSIEEEAVLKFYTTNIGYKDFNRALRGEIPMTDFYTAQEKLMNQALDKLPNSSNTDLYRIENLSDKQITNLYREGEIIETKSFTSSTYSEKAIIDAMRSRSYTVLIKIEGKNGKLIESLSTLPSEREILFKTGTNFKVIKIGKSANPEDDYMSYIRTIWIKEF